MILPSDCRPSQTAKKVTRGRRFGDQSDGKPQPIRELIANVIQGRARLRNGRRGIRGDRKEDFFSGSFSETDEAHDMSPKKREAKQDDLQQLSESNGDVL